MWVMGNHWRLFDKWVPHQGLLLGKIHWAGGWFGERESDPAG